MAFPTGSIANNTVYKIGNRAWVYNLALGVWDQVADNDTDASKLSGTLGPGVSLSKFQSAGHTLSWTSYPDPASAFSLATLNQNGYNQLAVGGTVRSATVLVGNSLFIEMSGGMIRSAGRTSESAAGFYYTINGSDPANIAYGASVPSTLVLNGLNVASANANSYRGLGSVSFMYTNSTSTNVTVKFRPCIQNQGVNWAWFITSSNDLAQRVNFTVVSIQG